MPVATAKGKEFALQALKKRRERNKDRTPTDNSRGYAGSPMYFPCVSCGDDIAHPESYLTRRRVCEECQALQACGWLE